MEAKALLFPSDGQELDPTDEMPSIKKFEQTEY
jgi:hypothetical protein